MTKRASWLTKSYQHPGNPSTVHHMLAKRTKWNDFSEGSGRFQCTATARSTGQRCRCNAVQGAKTCKVHGGMRNLAARIDKMVPLVRKNSKVCRGIARQYDVASAFALDDLSLMLTPSKSKNVLGETGFPSLSATGRKLQAIAKRLLNAGLPEK